MIVFVVEQGSCHEGGDCIAVTYLREKAEEIIKREIAADVEWLKDVKQTDRNSWSNGYTYFCINEMEVE